MNSSQISAQRVYIGNHASDNATQHNGDYHYHDETIHITVEALRRQSLAVPIAERIGIVDAMRSLHAALQKIELQLVGSSAPVWHFWLNADVLHEIATARRVLTAFEPCISQSSLSLERRALIRIESLVVLLTNALIVFDRLGVLLSRPIEELEWGRLELFEILEQIRKHNEAWQKLIDLVECTTELAAAGSARNIVDAVVGLLANDPHLLRRVTLFLECLDEGFIQLGVCARTLDTNSLTDNYSHDVTLPSEAGPPSALDDAQTDSGSPTRLERELSESRVYKRNQDRATSLSIRSSLPGSRAWSQLSWSQFSVLTLRNMVNMSIVVLPVTTSELGFISAPPKTVFDASRDTSEDSDDESDFSDAEMTRTGHTRSQSPQNARPQLFSSSTFTQQSSSIRSRLRSTSRSPPPGREFHNSASFRRTTSPHPSARRQNAPHPHGPGHQDPSVVSHRLDLGCQRSTDFMKTFKDAINRDELLSYSSLVLHHNQLYALPLEISFMRNLSWLQLSRNALQAIPQEVLQLPNLTYLDLSFNKIVVPLPEDASLPLSLQFLLLYGNPIRALPRAILLLQHLIWLGVDTALRQDETYAFWLATLGTTEPEPGWGWSDNRNEAASMDILLQSAPWHFGNLDETCQCGATFSRASHSKRRLQKISPTFDRLLRQTRKSKLPRTQEEMTEDEARLLLESGFL